MKEEENGICNRDNNLEVLNAIHRQYAMYATLTTEARWNDKTFSVSVGTKYSSGKPLDYY